MGKGDASKELSQHRQDGSGTPSPHSPSLIPGHASPRHKGSARRVWGAGGGHRELRGPQGPPCLPDALPTILHPRVLLRTSLHRHAPPDLGPPPTTRHRQGLLRTPTHTLL